MPIQHLLPLHPLVDVLERNILGPGHCKENWEMMLDLANVALPAFAPLIACYELAPFPILIHLCNLQSDDVLPSTRSMMSEKLSLAPQTKAKQATKATEVQRQATPQTALADAAQNDQVTQAALPTQQADQQKEQQATASPFTLPKVPSTTMEPEEQVEQAMRNRESNKKAAGKAKAKAKSKAKAKAKSLNTKTGPKCKAKAKSVAKATAKPEARQKSAGKVIQKIKVDGKTFLEAYRRKYYPEGCSKCRWTGGPLHASKIVRSALRSLFSLNSQFNAV